MRFVALFFTHRLVRKEGIESAGHRGISPSTHREP